MTTGCTAYEIPRSKRTVGTPVKFVRRSIFDYITILSTRVVFFLRVIVPSRPQHNVLSSFFRFSFSQSPVQLSTAPFDEAAATPALCRGEWVFCADGIRSVTSHRIVVMTGRHGKKLAPCGTAGARWSTSTCGYFSVCAPAGFASP